ncbi:protein translocase subunit SecF [Patescibacteria group bacterium]
MFIINNKKIFFSLSVLMVALSIFAVVFYGLNFGIDFKGGSITEVEYINERPTQDLISHAIEMTGIDNALIQPTGDKGYIVRTAMLEEVQHPQLLTALSGGGAYQLEEKRFNSIGPVIGEELKKKAWFALLAVVIAIILFIAFVFRHVSEPVSSWKYGLIAIVALIHDIIIPTGVFAFLGSFFIDYQIDILFVMALLAILGFSVNDTIVVFDRVRENLRINKHEHLHKPFDEIVGESLRQSFARSINTSLTTLAVLLALFFIGGSTTEHFALTLAIGVIAGTYSSIFLASPLLVAVEKWQK